MPGGAVSDRVTGRPDLGVDTRKDVYAMNHPDRAYRDEGLDLTDERLYANVRCNGAEATDLPAVAYRSKVFSDLEDEKIWTRTWVCAGTADQIPDPGDLLPFTVGNHGIHLERQLDGTIAGGFNFAQHGGCRTVPLQCQTGVKTKCSYTSCGYSRDRDVIRAADVDDNEAMTYQYLGTRPDRLLPVRSARVGPLVFVNLDYAGKDLPDGTAYPGPLPEGAAHAGEWCELDCNWKLAGEALLVALVRAGFGVAARLFASVADEPSAASELPAAGSAGSVSVDWVFPNLLTVRSDDRALFLVTQPTGMSTCLIRPHLLGRGADSPESDQEWEQVREGMAAVGMQRQREAERADADRPCAPGVPDEISPVLQRFRSAVVDKILATHQYYWNAPLYAP